MGLFAGADTQIEKEQQPSTAARYAHRRIVVDAELAAVALPTEAPRRGIGGRFSSVLLFSAQ